jgi:hypothetical protein
VGTENYFYRLQELTSDGVDLLRAIIKESPEGLRSFHERLLRAFTAPYLIKRRLEASGRATSEAMAEIDRMIIELNENVHTSIEEGFRPHLVAMISGKLDFLENPEKAAVFYRGLAAQYTRTNLIKQKRHARGYKVNCVNGHRKDHTGETRWLSTSNSSTSCWQTTRSQKTL